MQRAARTAQTILSLPARGQHNRYFEFFCDSLEAIGFRVVGIRDARSRRFRFDVLHLHFPTHFITETRTLAAISWAIALSAFLIVTKLLGKPIVYTVHNVRPFTQRRQWLVRPYLALVHRSCDAFVFLNRSSRAEFERTYPGTTARRSVQTAIGPYPASIHDAHERRRDRRALLNDDDAFVIGFLGAIKPYKNLEAIRDLPARLSNGRPVTLLVAGAVQPSYAADATAILDGLPPGMVVRVDRALSDDDLDRSIQACDAVMLPYARGWNSSAAMLVLSNHGRMLASNLPAFAELAERPGAPWVRCYDAASRDVRASLLAALDLLATEPVDLAARSRLLSFLAASSYATSAVTLRDLYGDLVHADRR